MVRRAAGAKRGEASESLVAPPRSLNALPAKSGQNAREEAFRGIARHEGQRHAPLCRFSERDRTAPWMLYMPSGVCPRPATK